MKPGWKTTEFWLAALVCLAIVVLAAMGRIDPASSLSLAAVAMLNNLLRTGLKSKALSMGKPSN